MTKDNKEITFTSEQLFDRHIYLVIQPTWHKAIMENNLELMYDACLSLYTITQQFYPNESQEIWNLFESVQFPQRPNKKSQQQNYMFAKNQTKLKLIEIWTTIYNRMQKMKFFKRISTIPTHNLAISEK